MQGQEEQNAFTIIVWDQLFDPSEVFLDVLETRTGVIYDVAQKFIDSASVNEYVTIINNFAEAKFRPRKKSLVYFCKPSHFMHA